jgi:hypothetical protein
MAWSSVRMAWSSVRMVWSSVQMALPSVRMVWPSVQMALPSALKVGSSKGSVQRELIGLHLYLYLHAVRKSLHKSKALPEWEPNKKRFV